MDTDSRVWRACAGGGNGLGEVNGGKKGVLCNTLNNKILKRERNENIKKKKCEEPGLILSSLQTIEKGNKKTTGANHSELCKLFSGQTQSRE